MLSTPKRVVIMGAAGRDFHNFNVYFRGNREYEVVAFTAAQIPGIEDRAYPRELAGSQYPGGIPIHLESGLTELIRQKDVDEVVLAYSDLHHEAVMHKACTVIAAGADFRLMGMKTTALKSAKPVISICAVRTGAGKSPASRYVVKLLKRHGLRPVVVRHPMPYGDVRKQVLQKFSAFEDLDRNDCTIEEREEYEPHLADGVTVFAGVDYEKILRQAEMEGDVIIWEGGNNDLPFYRSQLQIVIADPHRPGDEISSYPGEANVRMADILLINKVDTADQRDVEKVEKNVKQLNPSAYILRVESPITVDDESKIRGKRVLVIEDGPTLTHGGMKYGAAYIAAQKLGASEIVDPRPYAVGSIKEVYRNFRNLERSILPAMGYGTRQVKELETTVNNTPSDTVVIGTPVDLRRVLNINKPAVKVSYTIKETGEPTLEHLLFKSLAAKWLPRTN